MLKRCALVLAGAVTLLGAGPGAWLDAKTLVNWNVAGAALPVRPGPRDPELAPGGRCATSVRPSTSPEDRALTGRGWSVVGAYQRYGSTVVVTGTASADGMCRPENFQVFVFVNGRFAGTLAPHPMEARTDGSIAGLGAQLYNATDFEADFARYADSDALCCPHATSSVDYQVQIGSHPLVIPQSVSTRANPS